jgi:uncharacterized membrane protein
MAENDELDDLDEQDEPESGDGEQEPRASGDSGMVEGLMERLGENGRSALKPVASAAAVAAATYVARNGPQFLKELGGDKAREKLGQANEQGGVTGFAAGAAKRALSGSGGNLVERLKKGGEQEARKQAADSGGALGTLGKAAEKLSGSGRGGAGWGKGRRLPIMQSVDVAAPVDTVYNQWTQFEDNNVFFHRVEGVEQKSDATVTWRENIWGLRREWNAKITEQVPNERIAWKSHVGNGVITFHKLAPKLTRVEVVFDWQPTGLVEKFASGLRFHKRAAKADLKRFKAFVETRGEETGAWRGRIEEGKVKGEARNRRKRGADDIPEQARQHSEDDSSPGNGSGDDKEARERAREERARHRKERASAR